MEEIDWDVEAIGSLTVGDTIRRLRTSEFASRAIYRAYLTLGALTDDVRAHVQRVGSPENEEDFVPDGWSLQIGPILLGQDAEFHVGWIAMGLGGNGYLFPWSLADAVNRIESHPALRQVMELCRATWPVAEPPDKEIVEARHALGALWPYRDFDRPWDWYWSVQGLV